MGIGVAGIRAILYHGDTETRRATRLLIRYEGSIVLILFSSLLFSASRRLCGSQSFNSTAEAQRRRGAETQRRREEEIALHSPCLRSEGAWNSNHSIIAMCAHPYPSAIPPSTSLGQCASSKYRSVAQPMARTQKVI